MPPTLTPGAVRERDVLTQRLLIVGIIILVNLVSMRIFGRLDLTRNGAYSHGKLNYQFVDPGEDQAAQREASSLGVYQIQLTAIQKDQFEQKNGTVDRDERNGDRRKMNRSSRGV